MFHLLRNLGSSIFIAASVTTLLRTGRISEARLTEFLSPFNEALQFPTMPQAWNMESLFGLASVGGEIERQVAMIGYLNAFGLYTLASLVVLPLILLVRIPKRGRVGQDNRQPGKPDHAESKS